MTWNYRLIDFGTHVALHEVYYNADGEPTSWTENPASFVGDDVVEALRMALWDVENRPVLITPDTPRE